jgi:hypothetical protein
MGAHVQAGLTDRRSECGTLDRLIEAIRAGESRALVVRGEPGVLAGLPKLDVGGLRDDDARSLLDSALPGPLDARVRDLIVAETHGNPLALLELPRGLSPAQLAGGFGLLGAQPGAAPLTAAIEDSFARQLETLPDQTRRLVQLAAADPSGDRSLVWRAAGRLGKGLRDPGSACGDTRDPARGVPGLGRVIATNAGR